MVIFKKIPSISTKELESKLKGKIVLIDVRNAVEYRNRHIPGAKNIPLDKIENYQPKEKVYVICQSGLRSKIATKKLISRGYDAVTIKGGMQAWHGTV